jgi:hypothetical protein
MGSERPVRRGVGSMSGRPGFFELDLTKSPWLIAQPIVEP